MQRIFERREERKKEILLMLAQPCAEERAAQRAGLRGTTGAKALGPPQT